MTTFGAAISVMLLEHDSAGRSCVRRVIVQQRAMLLEAHDLAAFLAKMACRRIDLVFADLCLRDPGGIDAIRYAAGLSPRPLIFAISCMNDQSGVIPAIAAGASGFLCKGDDREVVAHAISVGMSGGATVTPSVACRLLHLLRERLPDALTPCETEVLALSAQGFSYPEIAERVGCSTSMIYAHVRQVYAKVQSGLAERPHRVCAREPT